MSSDLAIGIYIGTSKSSATVFRNGRLEIIPMEQTSQNNTVPSDKNAIFAAETLIETRFDNSLVKNDVESLPYFVYEDKSEPKIKINFRERDVSFSQQDIYLKILNKIKVIAEAYLNEAVANCVITVPIYFNESQRQATIRAGMNAGFNVLKLINEPIAAAIPHIDLKNRNQNILIYRLGRHTFDVSIVNVKDDKITVLATAEVKSIGGAQLNNMLTDFIIEKIKNEHKMELNKKIAVRRVRLACEKAKVILSSDNDTELKIDNLVDTNGINIKITREIFNDLCKDIFNSTLTLINKCLKKAKLPKEKIDEIVTVGGSSKIPKIRSILQEFFDGKELNSLINPEEAVAHGAAIGAASFLKNNPIKNANDKCRLSEEDVQRIRDINDSAQKKEAVVKSISYEKNRIYDYCFDIIDNMPIDASGSVQQKITDECNKLIEWIDNYPDEPLEKYETIYKKLKSFIDGRQYEDNTDDNKLRI